MRFGIVSLGFWLHFGRLLGDKIMKKGSPKSDENVDAFWEAILRLKWAARRDARGVWDWNLA